MALRITLFFLLVVSPTFVYAADHVVGGNSGWSLAGDFSTWAAGETFRVGDKLIFNYDSSHGVDEVRQSDYSSCSTSNAINSYTGGQTTITLSNSGPMYFVCPSFGHCGQGMKLSITVQGGTGGSPSDTPSTTTPSTPPANSNSPSDDGSGTPPSTTSAPASRNTPTGPNSASSSSISHLMLAFSLVLAALISFKG